MDLFLKGSCKKCSTASAGPAALIWMLKKTVMHACRMEQRLKSQVVPLATRLNQQPQPPRILARKRGRSYHIMLGSTEQGARQWKTVRSRTTQESQLA